MNFDEIYRQYWEQLYSTAVSFLKNREDALDVTQDAFMAAYESLDDYDEQYSLSTWLTQICMNKCRDKLRQKKRLNKILYSDGNPEVQAAMSESQEDTTTPDQLLEAEEGGEAVLRVLEEMQPHLLKAMTLKFIDQKSYKDVASEMDVPINTAKTWVRRGRQQLMQAFSPQ